MVHLSLDNFSDVVFGKPGKVLIECFLITCKSCMKMFKVMDDFEREHPEVRVCALNVGQYPSIGSALDVTSAPVFLYFEDGVLKDRINGAATKGQLADLISA